MIKLHIICIVCLISVITGCVSRSELHTIENRISETEQKIDKVERNSINLDNIQQIKKESDDKVIVFKILDHRANIRMGKFSVPIGSYIPWIPPSEINSLEDAKRLLPEDFRICNGPHAYDDRSTDFDETKIPKLTDNNSFMVDKIIYVIRVD